MSQQINLFNPIFRKKGFSVTSATAMLYGAAVTVAVAALVALYQDRQLMLVQTEAQTVASEHSEVTAKLGKLAGEFANQKPNAALESEIAALSTQLQGRQEIIDTLKSGAVGNTDGFSDYMRAFSRQNVSGLWLTGFDIAGRELAIQGRTMNADLVASYLRQLNQEKSLEGRQFAALRISQPQLEAIAPGRAEPAPNGDKRAAGQIEAKARLEPPRYLEFTISTLDIAETAPAETRPSGEAPLLGTISAAAVLGSPKPAAPQEAPR